MTLTWQRTRLKHLVEVQAGTWGDEPGVAGEDVYCVRAADFDRQRLRVLLERLPTRSVSAQSLRQLALRPGDIVIEKSGGGADQPVGGSVLFDLDVSAVCSNFAARLRPLPSVDPRFLVYLMAAVYYEGVTGSLAKQTTGIANLDMGAYMARECHVPELSGQSFIADYLDRETANIDRVISAKRDQITRLSSRTESLIASQLDPLVRSHGEVPLKAVAELRFSNIDKKSYDDETSVRLCNYTDVYYNRRIDSSLDFMGATASFDQIARFTLHAGDVLLTKDSETAEDIAVSAVVVEDLPGVVLGYHLALVRPTKIASAFLYWTLNSRRCRDAFSLAASGVTRFGLRQDAVGRVPIPNVDRMSQVNVVVQIEHAVATADLLGLALRRQVDLLLERRKAVIATAVSGGLDNSGVAA